LPAAQAANRAGSLRDAGLKKAGFRFAGNALATFCLPKWLELDFINPYGRFAERQSLSQRMDF
jgi:hypothetical protein